MRNAVLLTFLILFDIFTLFYMFASPNHVTFYIGVISFIISLAITVYLILFMLKISKM